MPYVVASHARQPLESSSSNWTAATYPAETTDFSADLLDSAFGRHAQVEPAVDESFYIHYPGDGDHPHVGRPSSSHTVSLYPAATAPTDNLIKESSLSPLSEDILTPTDERPHVIDDRHWYPSEVLAAQPQGLPAAHAVPQHPLSVKCAPAPPPYQQPSQPQHQAMPQHSLAARRRRPSIQPIAIVQPPSIGLGVSPRGPGRAQRPASAAEVDQFFDEVKDLLPGEAALPPTPTTPQVQRYHVAGVMLDAEDYSAYTSETPFAPRYVPSSSPTPMRAVYANSTPAHGPSRVAMMPPSPAYAHPPHTAFGFGFNYTIAPSQPYVEQHVHYAHTPPLRPRSAPASPELAYDGFEPYPAQQYLHRRPSVVGAIARSQHVHALQPSYYEAGYHPYAQVPRAHVRMQSHPGYSSSAPVLRPKPRVPGGPSPTATTASSVPPTPNKVPTAASAPSPTRRPSMARRKGKRSSSGAPTFINFTSVDAPKLLSGVAPSGTSKRKREETERRRRGSFSATSTSEEATAPAELVAT